MIGIGMRITAVRRAFSPLSFGPTLAQWLQNDAGLYQERTGASATTLAAADADPVGSWLDQSGNGRHMTTTADSKRPVLKLNIQNGRSVIRFDGIDDFLAASFSFPDPAYILMVFAQRAYALNLNVVDCAGAAGTRQLYQPTPSPKLTMFESANGPNTSGLALSTFGVFEMFFSGASSYLCLNGGSDVTGDVGTSVGTPGGLTLATSRSPGSGCAIDVGEVIGLTSAPSAANRAALRAYAKAKWGTP